MENKILHAEIRTDVGSSSAKRLRKNGRIPAVMYGKNEPQMLSIDAHEFQTKIKHISESGLLTLDFGKTKKTVLIKAFQDDPLRGAIRHLDFFEITKGEKLHITVPIVLVHGESAKGVKLGGMLEQVVHEVDIECLPSDIPEHLVCDVSGLGLNESIHLSSLQPPNGVRIITHGDQTVVTLASHREKVAIEEEGTGEVEVITESHAKEREE